MEQEITVNWQILFDLVFGVLIAGMGWFFREIWENQSKLAASLRNLEVNMMSDFKKVEIDMPSVYVRKDEFVQAMQEFKAMLVRIDDKLDRKADR